MQLTLGNPAVGDLMRPFELTAHNDEKINTSMFAGVGTVLVFHGVESVAPGAELLLALKDAHAELLKRGVGVVAVSLSEPQQQKAFAQTHQLPFLILSDPEFKVSAMYGALRPNDQVASASPAPTEPDTLELTAVRRAILFGPDRRILKIYDEPDSAELTANLLSDIDSLLHREPPRRIINHAPVLLVPNVLPPDVCSRLIDIWHAQGNEDSGFMKQVDGKTVGMYDYSHKIRRDHFLKSGPELDNVKRYISTRVIPAIRMAFNYEVSRFEDFRIACYDAARGGYFRPHRDNTTDGTAHRRFAMSLLLNDDYDGGYLRFPEYGLHEYRPQAGGAVIFSSSLLHEATDVTAGKRFVLLTFLYGEKEAKMREEYSLRTGGEYRAAQ